MTVIGVGNPDRGDDAAGILAARRLRAMLSRKLERVDVVEHSGEVTSLVAYVWAADEIVIVDACRTGAPAGTVRRFDAGAGPLPIGGFAASTHGAGVPEAIELARTLGRLPRRCAVYAIEGADFTLGAPVSAAVGASIEAVATQLLREVSSTRG